MALKITRSEKQDRLTLHLEGALGGKDAEGCLDVLRDLDGSAFHTIELDFRDVSRIDSFALGALIDLQLRFGATGRKMVFVGAPQHVKELFWDCCLAELFEVRPAGDPR
jgi:anti-anti-sigma factor